MASHQQIQTAQAIGLAAIGFHTGVQWAISHIGIVPVLAAESPKEKVALFKALHGRGLRTAPPCAVLASGSLAYAAYLIQDPSMRRIYSIAAAFPVLIIPYTMIFIQSTNDFLLKKGAEYDEGQDVRPEDQRQVSDHINKWSDLNYVRAAFPAIGTLIAIAGFLF